MPRMEDGGALPPRMSRLCPGEFFQMPVSLGSGVFGTRSLHCLCSCRAWWSPGVLPPPVPGNAAAEKTGVSGVARRVRLLGVRG